MVPATVQQSLLQTGKYIIGTQNPVNGDVSFSQHPVQHDDQTTAKREAERLLQSSPNKLFVVVKIIGVAQIVKTTWR